MGKSKKRIGKAEMNKQRNTKVEDLIKDFEITSYKLEWLEEELISLALDAIQADHLDEEDYDVSVRLENGIVMIDFIRLPDEYASALLLIGKDISYPLTKIVSYEFRQKFADKLALIIAEFKSKKEQKTKPSPDLVRAFERAVESMNNLLKRVDKPDQM